MLFGPNIRYFNELEINGEHVDDNDNEDFTNDKPESDDETTEEDDVVVDDGEDDDLTDFTEEDFDTEDEEPVDDTVTDEQPEDQTTEEDDVTDDYTEEDFNTEGDEPTDDTVDNPDDDLTDYTEEDFDDSEGSDDPDNADAGDNPDDSGEGDDAEGSEEGGESETGDSADNKDSNTLADMEKNLFSDLSPQQLAIKNNELLQNYIELYETINTIFDSINKIPKTFDNTRPLTFIADQLVELKDMVNYVITTTYVTRTYVENMAYYKQSLVVLQQLNTMLKALVQKPTKS